MAVDAAACSGCREALPSGARFCPHCGARVAAGAEPVVAQPAAAAGERRQVAILFADLTGYTQLSRTLDAEDVHRLLTRFFELTDDAIERSGGTIDKHIGDAVMGVFGAPIAHGNDIERALRAAVQIHAAMQTLSAELGRPLKAHVGIASGEVVAAATGSAAHHSYTVTGDAVNLASRLTELARSDETVITDDVQRAVAARVDVEPQGSVAIRGLSEEVRVWKLRALRSPAAAAQPLVGREPECRRFADLVAAAAAKRTGSVVAIRADPGMGKTRLSEALVAEAAAQRAACHVATVLDFGAGQGRDAIHALTCSLLDVPGEASAGVRRDALDRAIAAARIDAGAEPYLADLLALAQRPGSLYDAMDNAARQGGKLRALVALAEGASKHGACVLLIEDVHWASAWVQSALRELAGAVARHPIVLVMTTRRDGDPTGTIWPAESLAYFDLPPLARDDAFLLARSHLASSPDLARKCVDRAQGNPLFLVQLLRSGTDDDTIPASIQSVVLARLDRLAPRDKSAVQAASVIGQRFPLDLLRHLAGDRGYDAQELLERDLVRNDGARGDTMMFTHALIRDGAYASLLHSARRELHRAAAQWYEGRDATLRAEHLDRAEDPRAAEAYLAAARTEAAALRIDAALALTKRGAELDAATSVRHDLAVLEGDLLRDVGRSAQSIAAFERARDIAEDDRGRCVAWIGIASGHRLTSAIAPGLAALDAALPLATHAGLTLESSRIHYLRGSLHFVGGDVGACRAEHETALQLAQQAGDAECEAQALSGLADALYAQGRMKSAHAAFSRCVEICDRQGLTRFAIMNRAMIAMSEMYFGDPDVALARLTHARAVAREVQHRLAEAMADEITGWMLVSLGRYAEAKAPLARGIALAREIGARRYEAFDLLWLGRMLWHEGAREEARRMLDSSWTLGEQIGMRFVGPIVLGMKAVMAATEAERRQALADGEKLLEKGCVGHGNFWFYRDAIESALEAGEWTEAERYASALEDYTRLEPVAWSDFFAARGRVLAAAGRGNAGRATLEKCREAAIALQFATAVPALDAALAKITKGESAIKAP